MKTSKLKVIKETASVEKLVVQEINVVSADHSRKDISDFKGSLISAKSISYPNRSRLYDLYEDILLDGHLSGIVDKRILSVVNKNIYFEDASGTRVKGMDTVIDSQVFTGVLKKIMEAKLWGISGLQFDPGEDLSFQEIPRKHIKPEKKVIAYNQNDSGDDEGIPYEGISNVWIIGDTHDLGLLLKCSPYALYKRGSLGEWAQFIEIFGQPIRIMYYDAYDTKTKMELRQVLDASGSSLALMIPKAAQFEIKDGKASNANGELFEKFCAVCNSEMSVAILGNTETTRASNSSGYAQSKVHGQQQLEITKSDMDYVRAMLNSTKFKTILKSYGLPVDGGKFVFDREVDLDNLLVRIQIDENLWKQGVEFSDEYFYHTYGIPKPHNYDELKAKQEAKNAKNKKLPEQEIQDTLKETKGLLARIVAYFAD